MSRCYDARQANPYAGVTIAAVVDHVIPHRGDAALFWDEATNWQSLCANCHARKTRAGH